MSIVALTYVAAIDDPGAVQILQGRRCAFRPDAEEISIRRETDVTGRISKIGDAGVRTALYEAANVILTRPVKGSSLKSWAMRLAKRAGMRKAKVALGAQARRRPAPDAGRRDDVQRRQGCGRTA